MKGKTVVAGYDGSDAARVAVDYAARLVEPGDRLLVVHAYGPPPDWLGLPEFSRILEDHRTRGQAVLDGLLLGETTSSWTWTSKPSWWTGRRPMR